VDVFLSGRVMLQVVRESPDRPATHGDASRFIIQISSLRSLETV